uniref:Uncharacterized protein n=1 Tax=Arundo donax TaxID=35708 RepID=A0A0A9BPU7_ARUDO
MQQPPWPRKQRLLSWRWRIDGDDLRL